MKYHRDWFMPFKRLGIKWGLGVYLSPPCGLLIMYGAIFQMDQSEDFRSIRIGSFCCGIALILIGYWYINRTTKVATPEDGEVLPQSQNMETLNDPTRRKPRRRRLAGKASSLQQNQEEG